jgi:hypothetical protein
MLLLIEPYCAATGKKASDMARTMGFAAQAAVVLN